jgi:hypothetical protein
MVKYRLILDAIISHSQSNGKAWFARLFGFSQFLVASVVQAQTMSHFIARNPAFALLTGTGMLN